MSARANCQLTTKDYTILEVLAERNRDLDPTMTTLLRRKLSDAQVLFREDIPATVVTLSSRVKFSIDGGPAETRIVAHEDMRGLVGLTLPITTPRGLALLGLAEGQSITIEHENGGMETLTVVEVAYQPEAARREGTTPGTDAMPARRGAVLRLVHSADRPAQPQPQPRFVIGPDHDDPGPSAA